jgi:hypothetical protein
MFHNVHGVNFDVTDLGFNGQNFSVIPLYFLVDMSEFPCNAE